MPTSSASMPVQPSPDNSTGQALPTPNNQIVPVKGRRRRPSPTATAYSLALTVVRNERQAQDVAISALRKGGVARLGIIGHARHLSLACLNGKIPVSPSVAAADTAKELAWQLAGTRPSIERAIVDLELRYGLDAVSFAKALGVSTPRALQRAREVEGIWAESLDPALMASLGSAGCEELEEVLVGVGLPAGQGVTDPPTGEFKLPDSPLTEHVEESAQVPLSALLDVAPTVLRHTGTCEMCSTRLRSMTRVRALNAQRPVPDVPHNIAVVARQARRRIGAPPPPSIESRRLRDLNWKRFAFNVALVAASIAVLVGLANFINERRSESDRVTRLVEEPVASSLEVSASHISEGEPVRLSNTGNAPVEWKAGSNLPGVTVEPTGGTLGTGEGIDLTVTANGERGDSFVTISSDDGLREELAVLAR